MRYGYFRFGFIALALFWLFFSGCGSTAKPVGPAKPVSSSSEDGEIWALLEQGNVERVKPFFQGTVEVNARDSRDRTPLHVAAEIQSPEMAAFLLALGAQVDAEDSRQWTPLDISAEKLDGDTARILVMAGADIHHPIPGSSSAATRGIEARGFFLESLLSPASLESADSEGRTILHLAALRGNAAALDTILLANPPVTQRDKNGATALDLAFSYTNAKTYAESAEKLIRAGGVSNNPLYPYFAPAARNSNYSIRAADGNTLTHYAAGQGYMGYILFLVDKKADLNIKNAAGSPPLHEAARGGHLDVMKLLLNNGADPNIQDAQGNTALHLAIPSIAQREGFETLLRRGANPNLRDKRGDTPLHIAVMLNRPADLVGFLLEEGADPSGHNFIGKTPLHAAVEDERNGLITVLVQSRSDIFAADNAGVTPLELALREHPSMLPFLLDAETVTRSDSAGNTAMHIVVKNNGDSSTIAHILNNRAPINARNYGGDTALHLAVKQNAARPGTALLAAGADIFALNANQESPLYLTFHSPGGVREWMLASETMQARDGLGNNILHYAAQWRMDAHIALIVRKGASTEAANATGEPPLFAAVKIDSPSTVRSLLAAGASISSRDNLGNSALHAAVQWNALRTVETLISAGIDINSPALNGKTPLHDAVRLGNAAAEDILYRNRADFEVRDNEGNTPLMDAILGGEAAIVERLVNREVDTMVRNNRGDTPLHIAVSMERSDLAAILLRRGVSIHAKNAQGKSPFQMALGISPAMVSTLLTRDRSTAPDDQGLSPLHIAIVEKAPVSVIQIILDRGGRLNAVDAAGRTPLRLAVDMARWETVRFLADAGSNPFSLAEDNKSPAGIVLVQGEDAPIRAIFSGRGIGARDASGNTILHYAARNGSPEIVNLLLSMNADKGQRNISGESPSDIARRWNREDIAALLY